MVENLEVHFFQNNVRKCHTTLRVFPKRDGLTPSESLDAGLCTRTLIEEHNQIRSVLGRKTENFE